MNDQGDGAHHPGEDTRNLRKAGDAEGVQTQELLTQRRGSCYLAGGFTVIALTLLLNLATVIAYRDQPFPNPQAKLFANLAFVTVMVLGAACVSVGLIERMLRSNRARQIAGAATANDRSEQAVILLQRNIMERQDHNKEIQQRLDRILSMLGVVSGRCSAIEQGQQLLIGLLPEEAQRRYWAGFNDAVRGGYTATGTDGTSQRRRHIGLVPPEKPPED